METENILTDIKLYIPFLEQRKQELAADGDAYELDVLETDYMLNKYRELLNREWSGDVKELVYWHDQIQASSWLQDGNWDQVYDFTPLPDAGDIKIMEKTKKPAAGFLADWRVILENAQI